MKPFYQTLAWGACLLSLCGSLGAADDAVIASTAAARRWKDGAEVSVVSTNGNSKTTTTSIKNTFTYAWTKTALELIGGGLGASSGNQVTAEQYNASEKVIRTLEGKNYVFEKGGWNKDRFAGIRDRFDANLGLGRYLLDRPANTLNTEIGPGYVNEDRIDAPRNEFASGRVYAHYVHIFNASTRFSQDAEYIADFQDGRDYRLNTESALIAALTTHLSLKTSYVWHRVNEPPPAAGKDDTITSVALLINY